MKNIEKVDDPRIGGGVKGRILDSYYSVFEDDLMIIQKGKLSEKIVGTNISHIIQKGNVIERIKFDQYDYVGEKFIFDPKHKIELDKIISNDFLG